MKKNMWKGGSGGGWVGKGIVGGERLIFVRFLMRCPFIDLVSNAGMRGIGAEGFASAWDVLGVSFPC